MRVRTFASGGHGSNPCGKLVVCVWFQCFMRARAHFLFCAQGVGGRCGFLAEVLVRMMRLFWCPFGEVGVGLVGDVVMVVGISQEVRLESWAVSACFAQQEGATQLGFEDDNNRSTNQAAAVTAATARLRRHQLKVSSSVMCKNRRQRFEGIHLQSGERYHQIHLLTSCQQQQHSSSLQSSTRHPPFVFR